MNRKLVKYLLLFVAFMAIILAIDYFTHGRINISTEDNENIIQITKLGDTPADDKELLRESGGEASLKVRPGLYRVSVYGKVFAINKTVEIKRGSTVNHSLNPKEAAVSEPVATIEGDSIAVSNSEIFYLGDTTGELSKLLNTGHNSIFGSRVFNSVGWVSPGTGIGLEQGGSLYSIADTTVKQMEPLEGSEGKAVGYSAVSKNKVFVSSGSDIYAGSFEGNWKKIHTTSSVAPLIVGNEDRLAVINRPEFGEGHESTKRSVPFIEIINIDGKVVAKENIEAIKASWSPDGNKLLAINYHGKSRVVGSKLEIIATPPSNDISAASWMNNEVLIYATGSSLWSMDLSKNEASVIANLTPGSVISEIYIDQDTSSVYFLVRIDGKSEIRRIRPDGQKPPDYLLPLSAVMPQNFGPCNTNYINLSTPMIVVKHPENVPAGSCLSSVQENLQRLTLDTSKFQFIVEKLTFE